MTNSISRASDRASPLVPWIVGAFFALPVLIAKYPPMDDLPLHEASVGLLRHWGDPHFAPRTLYFLNFGHPNQLFSILVLACSYVMPIAWASKTVVAGILWALPVAAGRFADHVEASRWATLLVAPIGLGWLFFWGLIQNILGIAVLLALLPAIDRFAARPTARGVAWMCAAIVLLSFAHQAMLLVAIAALILCCVGAPLRSRSSLLRAAPIVFCGALVYVAKVSAWKLAGPNSVRTALFTFYPLSHKLTSLSGVLFGGYETWVRNAMLVLGVAPLALFAVGRFRGGPSGRTSGQTIGECAHAWRFELLSLLLIIVYFVAPESIKSTTLVYHRFLPPAWCILAVSFAARPGRAPEASLPRMAPVLCAMLPIASMLIAWPTFADSNRIYSDLETLIPRIEIGSSVLALNLGPQGSFRLWNPVCAMGHVVAERGGRSLFDYTQSPVSPVAQRPDKQWTESVGRMELQPYQMRPDWDMTRYRYLLIVTPDPGLAKATEMVLKKQARFIDTKGDWTLFESRLPVVAIDADDAPLPKPHPSSILKLLRVLVKQLTGSEGLGVKGQPPVPGAVGSAAAPGVP
ncbi:MAG: hypothetical protein ACREJ3_20330 [Polyangiaceae bacterium]